MTVELIRDEYRLRSLGSRLLAQGSGTFPACLSPTHPRCSWHCTHNFLLTGQRFLQPPPAGILGAGVQRGLLGRGFHQASLDSVRTECSFERHLLMDEWMNTQRGPGPSPCGAGSTTCTSYSAKVTLRSPGRIIFFPHVLSRCLFAPTHWPVLWSHGAEDRPPQPEPFHSTSRASTRQPFDAYVTVAQVEDIRL